MPGWRARWKGSQSAGVWYVERPRALGGSLASPCRERGPLGTRIHCIEFPAARVRLFSVKKTRDTAPTGLFLNVRPVWHSIAPARPISPRIRGSTHCVRTTRSLTCAYAHARAHAHTRARNVRAACRDVGWRGQTRTRGGCARDAMPRHSPSSLVSSPLPLLPLLLLRLLLLLLMTSRSRFLPPSIRQIRSFPFDKSLPEIPTKTHIATPSPLRSRSKCLIGEYRLERTFPREGKRRFQLVFRFYLIHVVSFVH